MIISFDVLLEAIVFGVLLGCFYAAVSIGLSVAFGLLDVPHVAHPAVMVLGSYCTYLLGRYGLDPILAGIALMPLFFLLGVAIYRFYYESFEKRGSDAGVRGLAFFFGLAFIIEVGLILAFAMLIVVGPVEPSLDRVYIGRTFAVVVLAGLGSMTGTLAAGLILGISESIVLMQFGASWAPAVAFGLLLVVLGIRPQGLFGR